MAHIHKTKVGQETSTERTSPGRPELHWHIVDGERTSTDNFGSGHTHTWQGQQTTGPIELTNN